VGACSASRARSVAAKRERVVIRGCAGLRLCVMPRAPLHARV
jgi:hypothetical protein